MKAERTKQITELIETELLKRGIIVQLTSKERKYGLEFTSNVFYTVPVLTRENHIKAVAQIEEANEKGISKIFVSVKVQYEMFGGGENAFDLFSIMMGHSLRSNYTWIEYTK